MKKSSPLVVIIPLIIALLIIASVLIVRYFSPVPEESRAAANPTPVSFPRVGVPTSKPIVGFEEVQSTTPVSDLRDSFNQASDGGTAVLDSLEQEASSL